MSASLPLDLRERIVGAYEASGVTCRAVAERFGVSHGVFSKLVRQHHCEESLQPHTNRCGRKRSIRVKVSKRSRITSSSTRMPSWKNAARHWGSVVL